MHGYCKNRKCSRPLIFYNKFREWIEFAKIKGCENKYMYVWEIFIN